MAVPSSRRALDPEPGPGRKPPKGVFKIDVVTGAVTVLATRPADVAVTEPHPIDGGRSILFVAAERSLVVRDIASGTETTLFAAPENIRVTSPAVSPDGQQIAFRVLEGFRPDGKPRRRAFMVIPRAGGEAQELAPHHDNRHRWGQAVWAPDARYLYFSDTTDDNNWATVELWRVPIAGGKPQKVGISMAGNLSGLSMHPDGRRIAFQAPRVAPGTWVLENFLPKK